MERKDKLIMNVNIVVLCGRLTRDITVSYTPSQVAVAEFSMAINKTWKNQVGEKQEKVCFVDCKCFSKQAEVLAKYVGKGDQLFVRGELVLDTWQAQDGTNRSKHRVIVENFQFMGSPKDKPQGQPQEPQQAKPDVGDGDVPY